MVFGKIKNAFRSIARSVLDLEETGVLSEQFKLISETKPSRFDLEVSELESLVSVLRQKHSVDSITVAYSNGSLLISSNGSDLKEAVSSTALLNYIKSEIPSSKNFTIKEKKYKMVFPFGDKVYIVKAQNPLNGIEMATLAEDIENFFKKTLEREEKFFEKNAENSSNGAEKSENM